MAIIITTYHGKSEDARYQSRKNYLSELISSVDSAASKASLHIIVDDGSTDGVCERLRILHKSNTRRVFLRREKREGEPLTSTNARNYAVSKCLDGSLGSELLKNQQYITFVDSDDLLLDVRKRTEFMDRERADFLYSDAVIFFDKKSTVYFWRGLGPVKSYKRGTFWVHGRMPYPTMIWRIEFLRKLTEYVADTYGFNGPFDPSIGCGEDIDVALSTFECASRLQTKIAFFPYVTVAYRIHDNSLASIRNAQMRSREEHGVLVRHFGLLSAIILHIQRFIFRPECYIPSLWPIRNAVRQKTDKDAFLTAPASSK